ncbi:MAG TPA: hypothetical protein VJN41_01050, partial [Alphaproteobacteria bacterium]|nr:hypothetical protein [Alphaproteobacteria bacterium]
ELEPTDVPGILRAAHRPAELPLLQAAFARLAAAARERRTDEALAILSQLVPEYRRDVAPAETKRAAP